MRLSSKMDVKKFISPGQVIVLLTVIRLQFSTAFIARVDPGNSIQDLILLAPLEFIINFVLAIPLLLLLKRHPGCGLLDCTKYALGTVAEKVTGLIYCLYFFALSLGTICIFNNAFRNSVIPEAPNLSLDLLIIAVCLYGAYKGAEAISRLGSIAFFIYAVTLTIIILSLIPDFDFHLFKPLLYNGPGFLMQSASAGLDNSAQIVFLAFLVPFIKKKENLTKIYAQWNAVAMIIFFLLLATIICVLGSYGSTQFFPLASLAIISKIGVFKHIDAMDFISWTFNLAIMVSLSLFVSSMCLHSLSDKKRKIFLGMLSVVYFAAALILGKYFALIYWTVYQNFMNIAALIVIVMIPAVILIVDIIKGRSSENGMVNS